MGRLTRSGFWLGGKGFGLKRAVFGGGARSSEGAPTGVGAEHRNYSQSDRESCRGDDSGCGGGNGGSGRVVDGLDMRAGRG